MRKPPPGQPRSTGNLPRIALGQTPAAALAKLADPTWTQDPRLPSPDTMCSAPPPGSSPGATRSALGYSLRAWTNWRRSRPNAPYRRVRAAMSACPTARCSSPAAWAGTGCCCRTLAGRCRSIPRPARPGLLAGHHATGEQFRHRRPQPVGRARVDAVDAPNRDGGCQTAWRPCLSLRVDLRCQQQHPPRHDLSCRTC